MAHIRKLIRDDITTTLTGLVTTGSKVYQSRVYPITAANLPGIIVYTDSESIEYLTITRPRTLMRTVTFSVEVYVKGIANYDDTIDTICSEIEQALYTDVTRGGNAKDTIVNSMEVQYEGDGDQPVALAIMQVNVEYVTLEGTPETAA